MTTPGAGVHSCCIDAAGDETHGSDAGLVFPYWSFTKTVIAACALKLAERGVLALDAPLPGRDFSLRQLLHHASGLPDYGTLPAYHDAVARDCEPWTRETLLDAAMTSGRLFAPGTGWAYSNIGYMLAREVIEAVAGQPLASVVRAMIMEPLGLESIELATTRAQFARVGWGAARTYHPGWVYHGCLTGTAADAAQRLRGLLTGKVLGPAMLQQMQRARPLGGALDGRPWTHQGYALGLMAGRFAPAGRMLGHSGGGPFSVCAVYHFPDRPSSVTVACFAEGRDVGVVESAAVAAALAATLTPGRSSGLH